MAGKLRLILGLVAVTIVAGGTIALNCDSGPGPVAIDDCHRVSCGMTEPEVETVLGRPADRHGPPRDMTGPVARAWGATQRPTPIPPVRESRWRAGRGTLQVQFNADGTACAVNYAEPLPPGKAAVYYLKSLLSRIGL